MNKRSVLMHQQPIMFTPDLAILIGVNCAIIIQKLEFLLRDYHSGKEIDGEKWIYNSYQEWREGYFPFWSIRTLERGFSDLECNGLICSCQPDGRLSRRKYYRVSEAGYALLTTKHVPDAAKLAGSEDAKLAGSCASAFNINNNTAIITPTPLGKEPELFPQDQSEEREARGAKPQHPHVPPTPSSPQTKGASNLAMARYRLCRMFNRKTSLPWSAKEEKALKVVIDTEESDWLILEEYYRHRKEDGIFCRTSIITLLNNWANDIGWATEWKNGSSFQKTDEDDLSRFMAGAPRKSYR